MVSGTAGKAQAVRESLEKIVSTGEIGTVNLTRCIQYLRDIEVTMSNHSKAITLFKEVILGLD